MSTKETKNKAIPKTRKKKTVSDTKGNKPKTTRKKAAAKKEPKKRGRKPTEITQELCSRAEALAAQGLDQDQIAYCLDMGTSTLYEKKAKYPEFAEAIKRGQAQGVQIVANSLFKSATNGNTTAQIFFLKAKGGWRDNLDLNLKGAINVSITEEDSEL